MKTKKKPYLITIITLFLIYCVLCAWLQHISLLYGVVFVLYFALGMILPGYMFLRILKIKTDNIVEIIGLSLGFGYVANLLCYFLGFVLFGEVGLKIIWFLMAIASIVFLVKKEKGKQFKGADESGLRCVLLLLVVLTFQFFTFAANNFSTHFTGANSYYCDLFYWAADAVTLTKQFPPVNFRYLSGDTYYYHYFSSIQVAVASMITNIPVYNFVFAFSFVQSASMLILISYITISKVVKKKQYVVIAMLLILFSNGEEFYSWVTPVSHTYIAPFGYDIGLSFGLLTLYFMINQIEYSKFDKRIFVSTMIAFTVCMGTKSPVACTVLVILGLYCLKLLLIDRKREDIKISLLYGVTLLVLFFVMYAFVVNGIFQSNSKLEQFINEGNINTVLRQPQVLQVYAALIEMFGYYLGQCIFLIIYILLVNPAAFSIYIIGSILVLFNKELREKDDIIYMIGVLCGILLTRGLKMVGFSQIYFIMSIMPYAVIFGIRAISKCNQRKEEKKLPIDVPLGICIIMIFLGIYSFINSMYFKPQLQSGVKKLLVAVGVYQEDDIYLSGYNGEVNCGEISDIAKKDYHYIWIDKYDEDVCLWVKENTNKNCVIVSNLIKTDNYQFNYPIGVIAERWIWMLDESLIQGVLDGDEESIKEIRDKGVSYLLINKESNYVWDDCCIIYENEKNQVVDLSIY